MVIDLGKVIGNTIVLTTAVIGVGYLLVRDINKLKEENKQLKKDNLDLKKYCNGLEENFEEVKDLI